MPTANAGFEDSPNLSSRRALTHFGPTLQVRVGFDWVYEISRSLPNYRRTCCQRYCIDSFSPKGCNCLSLITIQFPKGVSSRRM